MTATEHTDATTTLAAIRERVEAITQGEWYTAGGGEFDMVRVRMPAREEGDPAIAQTTVSGARQEEPSLAIITDWWLDPDDRRGGIVAKKNAVFIARAPADIRFLLDHIAALERQLADAQARERTAVAFIRDLAEMNANPDEYLGYKEEYVLAGAFDAVQHSAQAFMLAATAQQEDSHE